MRYRILGPLSVTVDGQSVAVTAGRDRVVLAMLLLRPHRIVGAGELIGALWDGDPPATARGQLQSCISRLRRILPPDVIVTDRAGYGIRVGPGELDAEVFTHALEQARTNADRVAFRAVLALRRGPVCAELDAPAIRQAAAVLDERYALAVEDWAELELAAGNERELAGELTAYVERFPLRERLRGQLMLALARSGRQADALAEFRRARDLLADELGIEPGEELQKRHREILQGDLGEVVHAEAVRCLPRTVGDFTGRREQIERLMSGIGAATGGPVVAVIDGMAGSGKTTLALHLASLLGDCYPDAHLFLDLQGHSERDPVEPAAALLVLLRQLGLAAGEIPLEAGRRVDVWRTETARRRVLVVLDNAASSAQLADLLPTAPGSLALVTSRRRLTGLDGVRVESLPVLTQDEAVSLLAQIAGARVDAEPEAAAEVVRRCGLLPLAVRLAGARLAHRARWRVADLLHRLGEAALPELAAEDRSVAGALTLTYRQLPEPLQRVFRLLGVYPGTEFDALAVAALTDLARDTAEDVLDALVDVNLVEEPDPGIFRMHDLVREFAATLAADLPAVDRQAALTGALDFQMHAAAAATSVNKRVILWRDIGSPHPARPDLTVPDPIARLEWERPQLAAHITAAIAAGRLDDAWKLARAAWHFLYFRGYMDDVRELNTLALPAAEASGDRAAVATVANYLASAYARAGQAGEAEGYLRLCLRLRIELGQHAAAGTSMANLASVYLHQGRLTEAVGAVQGALRYWVSSRVKVNVGSELGVLIDALDLLGRAAEALHHTRMRMFSAIDQRAEAELAASLLYLARIRYRAGWLRAEAAHRYLDACLRLADRSGHRSIVADAHNERAVLHRDAGRLADAVAEHRRAVEMSVRMSDARHQAEFRNEWAVTLRRFDDLAGARELHEHARRIAQAAGNPYSIARAHAGLADCLDPADPAAERHRVQAREIFDRIGVPHV
ncbi:AfsR family transcriptional regulator [Actinoplanes sp. SE50]|uniref:AfsR/SARP family transcriptional regulator n=1 Tax=unclassified Actinoplanes TaxID=2626549 RepID=UPI00023EDFB9|nr:MULTISPECIES: BTAD domain-containing putative transcriptional regulator [unclassified Actinoplanes]AEV88901.1 Regulatory protein afsR [Actinoplanes sp. SE50/110]ATO87307.1 AfsR family transcriptional regulator [Actinoplanes sp. SE50]SLM04725.1 SARP family transcriptional regulator [Actinoplanes sp. SE50/110]